MIQRLMQRSISYLSKVYPVLAISGPRQSGKTTLAKSCFPKYSYVNLEIPSNLEFAQNDPATFLNQYKNGLIIDEVQRCPELFSYIQGIVDENKEMAQFVLTGSQQFNLISQITQSLAGRVGTVELLPFSFIELKDNYPVNDLDTYLHTGCYPPIYDRSIKPGIWYEDYVRTYVERDVRQLINVKDLGTFRKFLKLCAARNGQLVNITELSNTSGIEIKTVKSWLSVLETSYLIFFQKPFHRNYNKRIVKNQKLYFYDSGLLAHLLGIGSRDGMVIHSLRGSIFEAMVLSEVLKYIKNHRIAMELFFWRNNHGLELDLILEKEEQIYPFEIKSGSKVLDHYFNNIRKFSSFVGEEIARSGVIYGGNNNYVHNKEGDWLNSWTKIDEILEENGFVGI
jgi:predicted AAA+ superfamily ATPase